MAYVKLDCGILHSTLWIDREAREIFITALLMAQPKAIDVPTPQLETRTTAETGWMVPPGPYGFVEAAGRGIISQAKVDMEAGLAALDRLANPEPDSRNPAFEGRRLVRVAGGFVVLNYDWYRDKDHTAAERMARYRAKKRDQRSGESVGKRGTADSDVMNGVTSRCNGVTPRHVTQADADADAEATAEREEELHLVCPPVEIVDPIVEIRAIYPKRGGNQPWQAASKALNARLREGATMETILAGVSRYAAFCEATGKIGTEVVMMARTFLGPEKHFAEEWAIPAEPLSTRERKAAAGKARMDAWVKSIQGGGDHAGK